ncbi:MAG: hypothetical protein IKD45_01515 [Clostridia bacterium]|nr:hypothetical protein [Clostridia bacterium]
MKKIICLLLALCCTLAMFSCANNEGGDNGDGNGGEDALAVEKINSVIDSVSPTRIVTHVDYKIGDETYKGRYTTEIDRASEKSTFDFSYQRLAIPGEDVSDSHIMTIAGKVYYKNGEASKNEGANWEAVGAGRGYLEFSLDLSENKLKSYEFSEDKCDLTATVAKADAMRVLGTDIDCDGDITVSVDTNGEYLYGVKITYTAADTGATVVVTTTYDYAAIVLDF